MKHAFAEGPGGNLRTQEFALISRHRFPAKAEQEKSPDVCCNAVSGLSPIQGLESLGGAQESGFYTAPLLLADFGCPVCSGIPSWFNSQARVPGLGIWLLGVTAPPPTPLSGFPAPALWPDESDPDCSFCLKFSYTP